MKKIIYLLTAVFVLSAVPVFASCGVCDLKKGGHSTEERVAKKMKKLTSELGLSDEQAVEVKGLITEKMEKKHAIKKEKHEAIDAVKEEYSAKIKAVLDDDQKVKFEKMKKEWKKGSAKDGHDHKGSGHEKHKGSGHDMKDADDAMKKGSDHEMKGSSDK